MASVSGGDEGRSVPGVFSEEGTLDSVLSKWWGDTVDGGRYVGEAGWELRVTRGELD